ncbi:Smr/MutS family protein [Neisseria leonii]|uniref:Smr/MutS family protein n=1 Tax=Neisseria leonii TaxID=2995413 RepID=UPI0030D5B689
MQNQDIQQLLKRLGKQAKQESEQKAAQQAAEKKHREEAVDFRSLMGDAVPLKDTRRYIPPRDLSPIKPRVQDQDGETEYFYVGDGQWLDVPATFSKNGQGQNDIRRLQSGHWAVAADVDLHGYTQEEAQQVLSEFIEFLKKRGVCGEIVHGSGLGSSGYRPVLKNLVRRWLMAHPDVLAYAEPHQGNDGAVRILIKRPRRED